MSDGQALPTVLVVDDNVAICRTLVRLLARSGYTASSVENGHDALAFVQGFRPSVVFLDIMMPGITGFDVLKAIRESETSKDIIVFMYSALSSQEYRERAAALGADEYLVKGTLSFDQIQDVVRRHLERVV